MNTFDHDGKWIEAEEEHNPKEIRVVSFYPSGPLGRHRGITTTARKAFEAGFYWPNILRDARKLIRSCDACQRARNVFARDETPQKWYEPFTFSIDMKDGAIELCDEEENKFIVNKQHVKPYQNDILDFDVDDDITLDDEGTT
nr:reverse transcriptase domain-containing protein [Tanacetum cinerariifolium]GEZ01592.1 reverse transcriptase domain-containing protein [Tanacetum cinerariifolium]GEZ73274.1 reverse transcriptase domain-containing protein [Tanacetum cinerariifolium]